MLADVLTSAASWLGEERALLTYVVPEDLEPELRAGQLVAVPYGERLVEGIVWTTSQDEWVQLEPGEELRPIHTILDVEPALQGHQMALAQWIANYYVTPLAYVAQMMLPPGLMQRSRAVLRLADHDEQALNAALQGGSLQLRALIGLLMTEGTIDVERLKSLLGPTRAKEVLKEVRQSDLFSQDSQLDAPRAKARVKRIVRLVSRGDALQEWRTRTEERAQRNSLPVPVPVIPDHVMQPKSSGRKGRKAVVNPWAIPEAVSSTATLTLGRSDKESLWAQHQLAAVDLLLHNTDPDAHWSVNALCKASGMTKAQFNQLLDEHILVIEEAELRRNPLHGRNTPTSQPLPLTPDQQHALNCIVGDEYDLRPILLHGVTGSGKTEVYLQALATLIAQGKQGIILVPEIALTTQAVLRVAARFPDRVAIIHSELSTGERYDEWRRIRSGEVDVVIGSRSALFAPLPNLGIIILDEEHEPAYKQAERRPTYHARNVALMLGNILDIPVVMGSATPAVESFYLAEQEHYRLVELPDRINATLPPVEVVDLRNELHAGNTSIISRRLQEELTRVLENRQQAILFLNRRGAASCVLCRDCGYTVMCEHCDIPMTYHSTERILLCHYCGLQSKVLQFCPQCKSSGIRYFGLGTEKIQETIQRLFPQARLLRWDRDTARNRRAHEQLLDRFANREADILIGTQMIAKGLDLPGVTLVGVVSADIALGLPDYSTTERAFTLLTQVAGRAGRGAEAGQVIIQTFNPQHFCIETASHHDYHEFYRVEIESRYRYQYPPFRRFVKFTYSHENRHRCQNEAILLYDRLQQWIERLGLADTDIVGPAPALMERVRGKYHWQMIVRGPDLHRLLRVIEAPQWEIDIDPVSTL
ncbi:primosomal protein N' [Dictyobacter aurantiacus]|uniref:Replication restart protein PriA n=1 Tax=Dictyobacter aurantiacus TaxID=1936993 RepID=A0A401ZCA6_9CHLR|nr:primosomal protein N' [Dictyobacter aurantiacus]GCE04507.1 primosomal protein N' [Dictyobacter aurantiacus]